MNLVRPLWSLSFALLFSVSRTGYSETVDSTTWSLGWKTVAEPSGGYSVVQTFTRVPLPSGEKLASKAEIDRQFYKPPSTQMAVKLEVGGDTTNGTTLVIKYFRGLFHSFTNSSGHLSITSASEDRLVTAVSTLDNTRLVVGVDDGPIYSSTNSGLSWETITRPGEHRFQIVSGDQGCGVSAIQTIDRGGHASSPILAGNWYAVTRGSDGSGLILSGGAAVSAPVLNISKLGNQTVLSWPGELTGYSVQQNSDLTTTNWAKVPIESEVVNGSNRVILPASEPQQFYRLKR